MNAKREDRYGTQVHVKKRKEETRQDKKKGLRLRGAEEPGKAGGEKLVPDVFSLFVSFVFFTLLIIRANLIV